MLFIQGIIIGFTASVPLGPIGVLCVQRTLSKGRLSGFVSGLGAAGADIIYALIAGLGLSYIINFIEAQQLYFKISGGIFLSLIGIFIFYLNPVKQIRRQGRKKTRLVQDFMSIFLITLSNPLMVFFFIAIFAGFGLVSLKSDYSLATILILFAGIFTGASSWWFILSSFVSRFRKKFRLKRLWWINKITGLILFVLGIVALIGIWLLY